VAAITQFGATVREAALLQQRCSEGGFAEKQCGRFSPCDSRRMAGKDFLQRRLDDPM
jgi:hypothetical protein